MVDNDSELSYLMTRYAKNLSSLYRMVSRHRGWKESTLKIYFSVV